MMKSELWMECEVSPGQFSTERGVVFTDHRGAEDSMFVDERDVDGSRIRVTLLDVDATAQIALVQLPCESFGGRRYASIPRYKLSH